MTANQINYFKAREEQRANIQREDIQREGNRIAEINANANAANAAANAPAVAETRRHNAQTELLQQVNLQTVDQPRVAETQRHQVAQDQETRRSNMAYEENTRRGQNMSFGQSLLNGVAGVVGTIAKVLA
jgi:hypothetical protein